MEQIKIPDGCQSALEHERRCTAAADDCEAEARRLMELMLAEPEAKHGTTITKLWAESLKARRLAMTAAREREDLAELRRLKQLEIETARGSAR